MKLPKNPTGIIVLFASLAGLMLVCFCILALLFAPAVGIPPPPIPKLRDAWISGIVDCPTAPDYGRLVTDGATVYTADGNRPGGGSRMGR